MTRREYDVTNLPKWAQSRISVLERNVEHWKAKAYQASVEGDTDTYLEPYSDMHSQGQPLPEGSTVRFRMGEGIGHYIDVRKRDDIIEVHSGERLGVLPQSSNYLYLQHRNREQ